MLVLVRFSISYVWLRTVIKNQRLKIAILYHATENTVPNTINVRYKQ